MPCGSDITGSPPGRRCQRSRSYLDDSLDPPLRSRLFRRNDVNSPDLGVSFRAIRGYRPGDYFTRGTTLGGNARACPIISNYEYVHPADGYSRWRPVPCAGAPRITSCARHCSPVKSEKFTSPRQSLHDEEEEEEEVIVRELPVPVKCECKTQVETKPVTSDVFTMTDKLSRDQGTMARMQVSDRAVDATLKMRDVATDTDDEFEEFSGSGSRSRLFSTSRRSIKFNPDN